jgi:hypothetical protein
LRGGYIIIRSGITDHLISSRLGFFEFGVYATIHLQANFKTGIWWGSAPRLLATAPSGTDLRKVQKALQALAEIGFLRPFHTHGARGNYPVLIDKYEIRIGALKGQRLNAARSVSWQRPFYEAGAEGDAERDTETDAEHSAEDDAEATPSQYAVISKNHSGVGEADVSQKTCDLSPQNGDAGGRAPEVLKTLGHRELKGQRTILLRSLREGRRLPGPLRASFERELEQVERLLGGTA